jgi:hypothetical protein
VEHNLDIYPHTGRQCVGCVLVADGDEPAPPVDPAPSTAPRDVELDRALDTGPPAPEPPPAPRARLRVSLDTLSPGGLFDDRVFCIVKVTLYGRPAGNAEVALVDDETGKTLSTWEPALIEGEPARLKLVTSFDTPTRLTARAHLTYLPDVHDEATATALPPRDEAEEDPRVTDVAVDHVPAWTIRAAGDDDGAVRTVPTLLSCPEEGVLFVEPAAALSPPLRVTVRGARLKGREVRAELVTIDGAAVASATVVAAHDDRADVTFERIPGTAFADRTVRVFVRAVAGDARADAAHQLTLVRMRREDVKTAGVRVSQYGFDVCVLLFALGTRADPPVAPAALSSIKRSGQTQLNTLKHFASELEKEGLVSFADSPVPVKDIKLEDVDHWMPVFLKVVKYYAIAVPATVTWPKEARDGLTPRTYHASLHIAGLAVDTSAADLAALFAHVEAITTYHSAPVLVRYEGVPTPEMKKKGIKEAKNKCVHVEYRAPAAKPAARPLAKAGAAKKGAAKPASGPIRVPDTPTRRHVEVGSSGHERMIVEVARTALRPCDSPRGDNRRFRLLVFVHGNRAAGDAKNADWVWITKKVPEHIARMNAAGHNVAVAVLEDARNGVKGWRWNEWSKPSMFWEALAKVESFVRELHPGVTFEGITLLCHSGGGQPVLTSWLKDPGIAARLRADDGEIGFLDSAYWATGKPEHTSMPHAERFIESGGRATFVWRVDETGRKGKPPPVKTHCEDLAKKLGAALLEPGAPRGAGLGARRSPPGNVVFLRADNAHRGPDYYDHTRISWDWPAFLPHLFHAGDALYATPLMASVTPAAEDAELECGALGDAATADPAEEAAPTLALAGTESDVEEPVSDWDLETDEPPAAGLA